MTTERMGGGVLLVLACLFPNALNAQQPDIGCLPTDGGAEQLLAYAIRLVRDGTQPYVETRQRYQIVASADAAVEIVTDEQTCKRAARSFARALGKEVEQHVESMSSPSVAIQTLGDSWYWTPLKLLESFRSSLSLTVPSGS